MWQRHQKVSFTCWWRDRQTFPAIRVHLCSFAVSSAWSRLDFRMNKSINHPLLAIAAISLCGLFGAGAAAGSEWMDLLAGDSLVAWKPYGKPADTPVAWSVEQGMLTWKKAAGHIVTKETFADFELELEWKISAGANSGVMFGVDEAGDKPWHSGPEIQILDDAKHRDGSNPATACGALYALYPPAKRTAKPPGEWNALRVRVQAGQVQAWLNGERVVEARIGSEDWNARVAKSKFAPFRQFAKVSPGRILLQDHGDPVWFRNVRVRRL
jgi:hypothetical protein